MMLAHKISGLPVLDHDRLVRVITESDIFRMLVREMYGADRALVLVNRIWPCKRNPPAWHTPGGGIALAHRADGACAGSWRDLSRPVHGDVAANPLPSSL